MLWYINGKKRKWYKQKSPTNRDVFYFNWRSNFNMFCAVLIWITQFHWDLFWFFGYLDLLWIDWFYLHGWIFCFSDTGLELFIVVLWYKDAIVSKPFSFFSIERCFLSMNDSNSSIEPLKWNLRAHNYSSLSDQRFKRIYRHKKAPDVTGAFNLLNTFCGVQIESHNFSGTCFGFLDTWICYG